MYLVFGFHEFLFRIIRSLAVIHAGALIFEAKKPDLFLSFFWF